MPHGWYHHLCHLCDITDVKPYVTWPMSPLLSHALCHLSHMICITPITQDLCRMTYNGPYITPYIPTLCPVLSLYIIPMPPYITPYVALHHPYFTPVLPPCHQPTLSYVKNLMLPPWSPYVAHLHCLHCPYITSCQPPQSPLNYSCVTLQITSLHWSHVVPYIVINCPKHQTAKSPLYCPHVTPKSFFTSPFWMDMALHHIQSEVFHDLSLFT